MKTWFFEASQNAAGGIANWGKFMLARFDADEWASPSVLPGALERSLIAGRGWSPDHLLVLDLQTGEGAVFRPGGLARADLAKHRVWVCPMFEPFLDWLWKQDTSDEALSVLPRLVELPEAEFAMAGYRRAGMEPCPGCGIEMPGGDLWAQVAHMTAQHPEIIEARLIEDGFCRRPDGTWEDLRAVDG